VRSAGSPSRNTPRRLADVPRKAKRYKYLLNKASICPACLASGRLKEVRTTGETAAAPVPLVEAKSSTTAPVAPEVHAATATPMMDELAKALPSHASELKRRSFPSGCTRRHYSNASRNGATAATFPAGVAAGVLVRASAHPEITKDQTRPHHGSLRNFFKTTPCGRSATCRQARLRFAALAEHRRDLELLGIPTEHLKASWTRSPRSASIRPPPATITAPARVHRAGQVRPDALRHARFPLRVVPAFLDDIQYPRFPHKVKCKFAGCPNDCVRGGQKPTSLCAACSAICQRSIRKKVAAWVKAGGDITRPAGLSRPLSLST